MRLRFLLLPAAVLSLVSTALAQTPVSPSQVSQIVAFGDSLSDTGNAYIASGGGFPGPGYAMNPYGVYTNPQVPPGPSGLWVQQFAGSLGVTSPAPYLAGGTDFAVGSALTGGANVQDMQNQVAAFFAANSGKASASNLYTFWGGANDISAGQSPVTAANNIEAQIEQLAAAGGQNFLWLNLPSLGDTPDVSGNPADAALANLASQAFDATWAQDLSNLDAMGINVIGVNVEGEFADILADPSAYGFTNTTTACDVTVGCDPNTALFWDGEHPTAYADSLIAGLAYADLTETPAASPTPEPSSFVLLGSCLLIGAAAYCGATGSRRSARPTEDLPLSASLQFSAKEESRRTAV